MNKLTIVCVVVAMLAAVALASGYSKDHNKWTFERFMLEYDPSYSDVFSNSHNAFELELRREIFNANMADIRAHNERYEQGLETWFMRPNKFADLTQAEFEAKYLGLTFGSQSDSAAARRLHSVNNRSLKIAVFEPIDWTARKDVVPRIVSQGSCGSCWAFAAATTLGSHINLKYGYSEDNFPSTQQATACTKNPRQCGGTGGCSGATAQLAFAQYARSGVVSNTEYPYTAGSGTEGQCKENSYTPSYVIKGYTDVTPNDKQALYNALKLGPVSVSAYASGWSFYGGGIFTKCTGPSRWNVNHAIVLTSMAQDPTTGEYFYKIANSWGSTWGESGFMRLPMSEPSMDEECGQNTSPFDGSACKDEANPRTHTCGPCGLLYDSAYPTGIEKF